MSNHPRPRRQAATAHHLDALRLRAVLLRLLVIPLPLRVVTLLHPRTLTTILRVPLRPLLGDGPPAGIPLRLGERLVTAGHPRQIGTRNVDHLLLVPRPLRLTRKECSSDCQRDQR